jgi:hypothetical protein
VSGSLFCRSADGRRHFDRMANKGLAMLAPLAVSTDRRQQL